jgi:1-deoxy-D-xylulose-5-phosphate reductoisomerase
MKNIAILGCTGSIGTQTLDIIRNYPDKFKVKAITAYSNENMLKALSKEFCPDYAGLCSKEKNALQKAALESGAELVVVASSSIDSLPVVIECMKRGINVALANKEVLVTGGELVMYEKKRYGTQLIPVDSEHSAVFQCMMSSVQKPKKIILTASGGAFRDYTKEELKNADYLSALKHPNWSMGEKITIDSATMFNKTLEVIEAKWLFDFSLEDIDILVHRKSMVHSMVLFDDNTLLGQVYPPSMSVPIAYALDYPKKPMFVKNISLNGEYDFAQPDTDRFPCARLAYEPIMRLPLMPTIMNAANDVCVEMFKQNLLCFCDFWNIISSTCEHFYDAAMSEMLSVENIFRYHQLAKKFALELIRKVK